MDSYPEDLLVGVFPLVFAIDTIQTSNKDSPRRTLFDRFLDAIAASLVEEEPEKRTNSLSIFRSEQDDSKYAALEEFIFGQQNGPKKISGLSTGIYPGFHPGFGRNKNPLPRTSSIDSTDSNNVWTFAKSLGNEQNFFQQARIEPIGAKHGLPPSKDPEGGKSLAYIISEATKKNKTSFLSQTLEKRNVDGIIPAGWLEKHVHALPSAILVVSSVTSDRLSQEGQDKRLFDTIEHLRQSLVPKRKCRIHVIGLLQDDMSPNQGDVWSRSVSSEFMSNDGMQASNHPEIHVTLLRASADLQASDTGMPTSPALKRLHRNVRDASLAYYFEESQRYKEKLSMMLGLRPGVDFSVPPRQLLPLVVRYCFKISMFYEFQWKHQKSLLYMNEGYKHVCRYYQYLISTNMDSKDEGFMSDEDRLASASVSGDADAVEVSLSDSTSASWSSIVPPPPGDMLNQCRVVAEWMNLKIMSAALSSRTEAGLLAASTQWQEHSRLFCSDTICRLGRIPVWNHWAYVSRQRTVMSQLLERYPPTTMGNVEANDLTEAMQRCSLWRTCASATEALLRLSSEVSKAQTSSESSGTPMEDDSERGSSLRPQFIGQIGSKGLQPYLAEESRVTHRARALDMITRAISLYEGELEREKRGFFAEDSFSETSSCREGARMYYLAGGILLGMGCHEAAASKLSKAARFVKGWNQLELSIRRMLIECYEKHIPPQGDSNESDALASMILDSYFNAQMSPQDLRKALGHFLSVSGGESLKWFHKSVDDEDADTPFSFAVSFPWKTQTIAGDAVQASVAIRSNLDYAVHVNSALLLTLAGNLPIPSDDLRSATNASEGSDGGIIIQAKTLITILTEVKLPKDTSLIASDDSGNGGEQLGVAGKGSFAKNARPRSAGITAAGGARFLPETGNADRVQHSQGWNLRFLGGKPLRCDGLRLIFYPVQAAKSATEKETLTLIELTIKNEKSRTAANIKRTPFEEENYVASAWSRPAYLPLARGPRSLRVSGPMPNMMVSNLTEQQTHGKAVEGTINRIVLKLQAGSGEECTNVSVSVSCFSVLVTPSGSTKRLVASTDVSAENENALDMADPAYRTPGLVHAVQGTHEDLPLGYKAPDGWATAGTGQKQTDFTIEPLKGEESSYIHFDIYRPASEMEVEVGPSESLASERLSDWSICKTDYYVNISYRQERPSTKKMKPPTRGQRRSLRRPTARSVPSDQTEDEGGMTASSMEEPKEVGSGYIENGTTDEVTLEFTGSLVWTSPLAASFARGSGNKCPSGSRNPSNSVEKDPLISGSGFSLVDREHANTLCKLRLDPAMEGLQADIISVNFKPTLAEETESKTNLVLKSQVVDNESLCISKTHPSDVTRRLSSSDSEFHVSYVVQANMKPEVRQGGVSSHLGVVEVRWLPAPIHLPVEVVENLPNRFGGIVDHGPLALEPPSKVHFQGPPFYIESAPFEARLTKYPVSPCVPEPFDICYRVQNLTNLHQSITVKLTVGSHDDGTARLEHDGVLLAGFVDGELILGPQETRTISYTYLALKPGRTRLPALEIASSRYRTWIIHEQGRNNEIYISP